MESVLENVDKDKERALRSSARIERMRREKQRQMRKRRMLKKYFRLGIAFLGLVVIIVTSVSTLGKKSKTSEAQFPIEQGIDDGHHHLYVTCQFRKSPYTGVGPFLLICSWALSEPLLE